MQNDLMAADLVVTVLTKGDAFPGEIDNELSENGWLSGQGVMWTQGLDGQINVARSDGYSAGFLLKGSDDPLDRITSMAQSQVRYRAVTVCAGGWVVATPTFEKYTWASRQGPGPLVEIQYEPSDWLVFSLRGYWTKEDEWSLSGDIRAPNAFYIGSFVSYDITRDRIVVQTGI